MKDEQEQNASSGGWGPMRQGTRIRLSPQEASVCGSGLVNPSPAASTIFHNEGDSVTAGELSKKHLEVVNFTIPDLDPCHIDTRREEPGQHIIHDIRVGT